MKVWIAKNVTTGYIIGTPDETIDGGWKYDHFEKMWDAINFFRS